ncbi:BTAD domain-containing putative transcriptional regulator [Aeromicrobium sp. REDSEA-S38_B2]|uniref:AfsR/SARP family transcriptional regulator n=1 Tax=Aeromicrobium sp. REDSEA-S38_B2 TaxID=1811528 RepID=UPI0025801883|nr:BTAD domain-containing putative transcriptional regulator [Aeromicrobium sp. REDSEA-S38_B2]
MDCSGDRVVLTVLAGVTLQCDGAPVALSSLERALLAGLAVGAGSSSDTLVRWLYDDAPPTSARNRVQALVSGLRRKCDAPLVRTAADGYVLDDGVTTDVGRLRACRDRARARAQRSEVGCLDDFRTALDLVPEEVLLDVRPTSAVELERTRLAAERLGLWEEHVAAAVALGRADTVVADLALLTALHPFHEGLLAHSVLALASVGRREQALRVYREAFERLDVELGVEPSDLLRSAHARVLEGDVVPVRASDVTTVPGADTALRRPTAPRTLPRRSPGFVGRAHELEAVLGAAQQVDDGPVVVHLTGLPGMGKSTLAVEAGHRLRDRFPDGSLHLDAGRTPTGPDAGAALGTFLRLLGTHPEAVPADVAERAALYRSLLHERRVLVVLDDVGADVAAPALLDLLPASAGSMAVVVSRRDLPWLDADVRVPVGSLSTGAARELLVRELGSERVERDQADADRLSTGDDGTMASIAASLAEVWEQLPGEVQEAAHRVARLRLPAFSAWVLGALLGDDHAGERAIDALSALHLVEPVRHLGQATQFKLHDVVARFLRGTDTHDDDTSPAERVAALLLERGRPAHRAHPTQLLPEPPDGARPTSQATTSQDAAQRWDRTSAVRFFATENATARVLADWVACLDLVGGVLGRAAPDDVDAATGRAFLDLCRAWHLQARASSSEQAGRLAESAAARLVDAGHPRAAAAAQVVTASAALALGRRDAAVAALDAATAALDGVHDPVLAGWVANGRGTVHNDYDENEAAAVAFAQARALLEPTAARAGYRQATLELSRSYRRLGVLGEAQKLILEVVGLLEDDGDDYDRGYVLDAQAEVAVALGRGADGVELARSARAWAVRSRDAFVAARARRTLAGALRLEGRPAEAEAELRLAVTELTALGRQLSAAAAWRALAALLDDAGRTEEAAEALRLEREASAAAQAGGAPPGASPVLTPPT